MRRLWSRRRSRAGCGRGARLPLPFADFAFSRDGVVGRSAALDDLDDEVVGIALMPTITAIAAATEPAATSTRQRRSWRPRRSRTVASSSRAMARATSRSSTGSSTRGLAAMRSRARLNATRRASDPGVAPSAAIASDALRPRSRAAPSRSPSRSALSSASTASGERGSRSVHGALDVGCSEPPVWFPAVVALREVIGERGGRGRCGIAPFPAGCRAPHRSRRSRGRRGRAARRRRGDRARVGSGRRRRRAGRRRDRRSTGRTPRGSGTMSTGEGRRARRRASSSAAFVATR